MNDTSWMIIDSVGNQILNNKIPEVLLFMSCVE